MVLTQLLLHMALLAALQPALAQSLPSREHTVLLKQATPVMPRQPQLPCLLLATELVRHTAHRPTAATQATSKQATSMPATSELA